MSSAEACGALKQAEFLLLVFKSWIGEILNQSMMKLTGTTTCHNMGSKISIYLEL